ncbi:BTAD domain-containing putative transcriptional regulator, partial [Streptomyces olivaceoviridis]
LRHRAAEHGITTSAEVRRRLAAAGLRIGAGKMSALWSTTPVSVRLDDLEVICVVLSCEHSDLVPELLKTVTRHPFRERARAQLMLVLHRCGRQSEALAVYHERRQMVADELGVDPSQVLTDVYQGILTGRPELRPAV